MDSGQIDNIPYRAALYVPGDDDTGEIEGHLAALRRSAASKDYLVVGEYADGAAGYPNRAQLLRDAQAERFDIVLTRYQPDPDSAETRVAVMRISPR